MHRRTPACVERSMASDPHRRSVVPPTGDTWQERSARCQRQPSQATCEPRRSPNSSMCHQRRSAAGRRRAGCPSSAPWAVTDATPTPRSGPCWKPCPSYPEPASRAPLLSAPASLLSVARWPFGIVLRLIGVVADPGPADFLRARDNPGDRTTWANARRRLLTCAID
jgi:hypothetical protein